MHYTRFLFGASILVVDCIGHRRSTIVRIPPVRQQFMVEDCSPRLSGKVDHDVADDGEPVEHDAFPFHCECLQTVVGIVCQRVASSALAFLLRRVCHHSYLGDAIQDFPEKGVIHLRAVHRSEGTAGETLLFIHRFAALEDEGTAKAIEKPCGACDILHSNLAVCAQRAYPHRKWFHCPTPV